VRPGRPTCQRGLARAVLLAGFRVSRVTRAPGGSTLSCASLHVLFPARLNLGLQIPSYNQLKRRATVHAPGRPLSTSQYPLSSAEATLHTLFKKTSFLHMTPLTNHLFRLGSVTAVPTNPMWVAKVRTFTALPNSPVAHLGVWSVFAVLFLVSFLLTK